MYCHPTASELAGYTPKKSRCANHYLDLESQTGHDAPVTDYSKHPLWLQNSKVALNWFIETMGTDQWEVRSSEIVSYFNGIIATEKTKEPDGKDFVPIAVYADWMGWYMYLIENLVDRPECDEPMQSSRIIPFFSAIGRNIEELKKVRGIEDRLRELLIDRNNQPDSTLYDLVVAATYLRNGWNVSFIKETPGKGKTPDFMIWKGNICFQVECKRLQKTAEYSEAERQEWIKRWKPLSQIMEADSVSLHVDVTFHVPLESTGLDCLTRIFTKIRPHLKTGKPSTLQVDGVTMEVRPIDVDVWERHFREFSVRSPSPQMIILLVGGYSPFGKYTHGIQPTSIEVRGKDDGKHVCNVFFAGIKKAYSAEWRSLSEESINMKAKDVKRKLSQAVAQLSENCPGIVHIGYETHEGPVVEFARKNKIDASIIGFDPGSKNLHAIFINAMQPSTGQDGFGFECAETTLSYACANRTSPDDILSDNLILQTDDLETDQTTHWDQDYARLYLEPKSDVPPQT